MNKTIAEIGVEKFSEKLGKTSSLLDEFSLKLKKRDTANALVKSNLTIDRISLNFAELGVFIQNHKHPVIANNQTLSGFLSSADRLSEHLMKLNLETAAKSLDELAKSAKRAIRIMPSGADWRDLGMKFSAAAKVFADLRRTTGFGEIISIRRRSA